MKRFIIVTGIFSLLIGLLSAIPLHTSSAAEKKAAEKKTTEKKAATEKKSTATKKTTDAKKPAKPEEAKFKGRLPAYYGSVVDDKQRDEIYGIQKEYYTKLDKLKKEYATAVKALMAERNDDVADVLTDEQKEKVAELKVKRSKSTKTASKKPSTTKKK